MHQTDLGDMQFLASGEWRVVNPDNVYNGNVSTVHVYDPPPRGGPFNNSYEIFNLRNTIITLFIVTHVTYTSWRMLTILVKVTFICQVVNSFVYKLSQRIFDVYTINSNFCSKRLSLGNSVIS